MPGKLPRKDFAPAGVPANIYNLVRALEQQYTLNDKISFYCKTNEEMQQCASYFFERAVIYSDPRKFAAVAVKMLKFYPSEDITKLTFKNALLGELKVKCYDAIFESNVSTERAVGIVKFFGELYNVGLIISGILKKQFDALNERKTDCAKSRKCLYTLVEIVKKNVRELLQTDQSTVVRKTIEMIEEVEANPQFYEDPPPQIAFIRKLPCKPIVQEPKTSEEKKKAFERLMTALNAENSGDIIKKIKENYTYLFADECWKLAYKELVLKALKAPEFAGSVADICLKSLPNGSEIKKEDCRKLFYDILKTTIGNGLIDESDEHLEGVMTFIDKMIDRKIVSISNIREIIDLIKTFQGDHSCLAATYLVQLFNVIKLSKKIKQKKIQELDEDLRKDVIDIVKSSSEVQESEIAELQKYLFGDVSNELSAPSIPHVSKQMLPFPAKSEDKENSSTTAKKVRNKKKVFVDYCFGQSRNGENSIQQAPEPRADNAWNNLNSSYDDITKILDGMYANNGEIRDMTSAFTHNQTNAIKATEADDDYNEFIRKEFPDLVQPSTDNSQQEAVNQTSSSSNDDVSEHFDFFETDKEKAEQTKNSYVITSYKRYQSDFDVFNQDFLLFETSNDNSRSDTSSRFMDLFKPKQAEPFSSPLSLNGASSSSSIRGSPASPFDVPVALDSNDYIVPSFNFSALIDNFAKNEYANIKELVEQASTRREWDWKKFAEELLAKTLKEKDLETYIQIGMLVAKTSPNFKKVLGDVALSALGNELGKEIALDFVVENESDDTATYTANFISLLYDKSCLSDSQIYQCMSHIATGKFENIRRVKIFIALLRPAANKIKRNLRKEVLIDYLQNVLLSAIEPMKSTDQWTFSELIDLLRSLTATLDDGNIFQERTSNVNRTSMSNLNSRSMVFPGPVRYSHPQEQQTYALFDPRVFAYPVSHHHLIRSPPFNSRNSTNWPNYVYDLQKDNNLF